MRRADVREGRLLGLPFSPLLNRHTHITQPRDQRWWWRWNGEEAAATSGPSPKLLNRPGLLVTFLKCDTCNTMGFGFPLPHKGKHSSRKSRAKRQRVKGWGVWAVGVFNQALKSSYDYPTGLSTKRGQVLKSHRRFKASKLNNYNINEASNVPWSVWELSRYTLQFMLCQDLYLEVNVYLFV